MRVPGRGRLAWPVLALSLIACGASPGPTLLWPVDPDAATDPARMVATPTAVEPGELVELTFPDGHDRGLLFAIDEASADDWQRRAMLLSDANGGDPRWSRADADDLLVEMVGIAGPGPDRVPIPEGLPPGDYRICTANAVENLCVPIEIVAP
jgi:hypothetical protein